MSRAFPQFLLYNKRENMVRPLKPRRVLFDPDVVYFKPRAVPLSVLEEVDLSIDELEALRLCDYKNLEQTEAAKKMKISQSTLQRILTSARKKVAEALIEGKAIKIRKEIILSKATFLLRWFFGRIRYMDLKNFFGLILPKEKFNKSLRILITVNTVMVFIIGMLAPFYAVFVQKIGGNIAFAGFSWALFSIVAGVLTLLFGRWQLKVKEQELLLALGYLIRGIVFLSYAFMGSIAQLIFTQIFWELERLSERQLLMQCIVRIPIRNTP